MKTRSFAALLALAAAPLAARAADAEHPYAGTKVGDTVTYKTATKFGDQDLTGTTTMTVTAKTDKEVTIKSSGKMGDRDIPERESKIDLTKPFVPPGGFGGRGGAGAEPKVEKLKDGKEKVKVGDKDYDAAWTTYKVTTMLKEKEMVAEVKVWTAKDVPLSVVKVERVSKFGDMEVKSTTEFEKAEKKDK